MGEKHLYKFYISGKVIYGMWDLRGKRWRPLDQHWSIAYTDYKINTVCLLVAHVTWMKSKIEKARLKCRQLHFWSVNCQDTITLGRSFVDNDFCFYVLNRKSFILFYLKFWCYLSWLINNHILKIFLMATIRT